MRLLRNFNSKDSTSRLVRVANACLLVLVLVPIAATERLPASFSGKVARMVVEIEGVNYGSFTPVKEIDRLADSRWLGGVGARVLGGRPRHHVG